MTVEYSPEDVTAVSWIFLWRGSILSAVLKRPMIWVLTTFHSALLFAQLNGYNRLGMLWQGEDNATATISSITVFFLVFYAGQCYTRFYAIYDACMGMYSAIVQYAGLLRVYVPGATREQHWNAVRHLMAAAYVFYFGLEAASLGGSEIGEDEWAILFRLKLLEPAEREVIVQHFNRNQPHLLCNWALEGLQFALKAEHGKVEPIVVTPFIEQVQLMRGHCASIRNMISEPIPYPYYTTLMSMLSINLLLLAYALTATETYMSIPIYFTTCLVLLGLKEVSVGLSSPFGLDAVDLDVDLFMGRIMLNVKQLLSPTGDYTPQKIECPPIE